MTDENNVSGSAEYKNRKVGLIIYGVIQVLIGGMCALALPMMAFAMIATAAAGEQAAGQQLSAKTMIPGMLVYLVGAVWFVWLGIGSIMTRRWARALTLVASWIALIGGIAGMVFWVLFSPQMYGQMELSPDVPREMLTIIRHITTVFLAVIYVIGPAAFVLFYKSKHVKATCEALDPKTRWTDRCPLPVLGMALLFAVWGSSMVFMASYGFALPCFGRIISGAAGAVVCLVLTGACWWTAVGMYKLKVAAWWTGMAISITFLASSALTFSRVNLVEYYEAMGMPEEQVQLVAQMDITTTVMFFPMIMSSVLFLGYLVYTKRYFSGAGSASAVRDGGEVAQ